MKKKIGARNKKQVEDQAALYAEVEQFACREEIRDHYGWAWITEDEMRRLFDIWDAREVAIQNSGRYAGRVTELLQRAMDGLGEEFLDQLARADEDVQHFHADLVRIERENAQHSYQRWQNAIQRESHQYPAEEGHGQDGDAPDGPRDPQLRL